MDTTSVTSEEPVVAQFAKVYARQLPKVRDIMKVIGFSYLYGSKLDLAMVDDLKDFEFPVVACLPVKNTPHGPQRNSRKGKVKKW
jgi:hypothetical protein